MLLSTTRTALALIFLRPVTPTYSIKVVVMKNSAGMKTAIKALFATSKCAEIHAKGQPWPPAHKIIFNTLISIGKSLMIVLMGSRQSGIIIVLRTTASIRTARRREASSLAGKRFVMIIAMSPHARSGSKRMEIGLVKNALKMLLRCQTSDTKISTRLFLQL